MWVFCVQIAQCRAATGAAKRRTQEQLRKAPVTRYNRLLNDFNLDTSNRCEVPKDPSSSDRMEASYRDEIPESSLISLNLCSNNSSSKQAFPRTIIHIKCRSSSPKNVKATKSGMKDFIDCDRLPLALGKKTVEGESIMTLSDTIPRVDRSDQSFPLLQGEFRRDSQIQILWFRDVAKMAPACDPAADSRDIDGTRHSPNNESIIIDAPSFSQSRFFRYYGKRRKIYKRTKKLTYLKSHLRDQAFSEQMWSHLEPSLVRSSSQ